LSTNNQNAMANQSNSATRTIEEGMQMWCWSKKSTLSIIPKITRSS